MTRQTPRILVDVDDCLCDFKGFYISEVNRITGRTYKVEQITSWSINKCLDLESWVIREIDEAMAKPNVAHRLEPIPEALANVRILSRELDVVFVTSPLSNSKTWVHDRSEWLIQKFGDLGKRVVFTHHKELVHGDALIDDKPENIIAWNAHHPRGLPIVWDQPSNRYFKEESPIVRLATWPDVVSAVRTFCAKAGAPVRKEVPVDPTPPAGL